MNIPMGAFKPGGRPPSLRSENAPTAEDAIPNQRPSASPQRPMVNLSEVQQAKGGLRATPRDT